MKSTAKEKSNRIGETNELVGAVERQMLLWGQQMLDRLLPWTAALGVVALGLYAYAASQQQQWAYLLVYSVVYLLWVLLTLARQIAYPTRARVLLGLLAVLGVAMLAESGLRGAGPSFLLILPLAGLVLLSWRTGLLLLALGTLTFVLLGVSQPEWLNWILAAAVMDVLVVGAAVAFRSILRNLVSTTYSELLMRQQLDRATRYLEEKVGEQASLADLRALQLDLGEEIRRVSPNGGRRPETLQIVLDRIAAQLGLDQVNVYLSLPQGAAGTLAASSGRPDSEIVRPVSRVAAGDASLVGRCLASGQAGVEQVNGHVRRVFPLAAGEQRLGALESLEPAQAAGERGTETVLDYLAGQLGLTLDTWRLRQEVEKTQEGNGKAAVIPLNLRGRVLGHLLVEPPAGRSGWSDRELGTLEIVAQQMVASLESRKELEERRRQAEKERLVGRLAAQMRETLDIDTVLQIAVREIGEALDLSEVQIRISGDLGGTGQMGRERRDA